MKKIEVEVLSEGASVAIIRIPGQDLPGLVIQGNALRVVRALVHAIEARKPTNGRAELKKLGELVTDLVECYEIASQESGIELPNECA